MWVLPYLVLFCQSAALVTRFEIQRTHSTLVTEVTNTVITESTSATISSKTSSRSETTTRSTFSYSSLVTMAPLSRNPLELRQKCFNDQGFSVDCATWTGYYYTWGPPGNPYEGGPGDDGSSSGTTVYTSKSSDLMPIVIGYILLLNAMTLYAAFSLS